MLALGFWLLALDFSIAQAFTPGMAKDKVFVVSFTRLSLLRVQSSAKPHQMGLNTLRFTCSPKHRVQSTKPNSNFLLLIHTRS